MKKYAVLVGVEEYSDPRISPLRFARADVAALGEALCQQCAFDEVRVLAEKAGTLSPELPNIIDALGDLVPRLEEDDLFLFYFAGHGVEVDGQGYLLTPGSRHAFPQYGSLSLNLLRDTFSRLAARRRILMLDACRNSPEAGRGDADNSMGEGISRDIAAAARAKAGRNVSTSLLAACSSGQRAYEWPEKGHGVFTYFLLEGLSQAAWGPGGLAFRDLAAHASRKVAEWCEKMPGVHGTQDPWYEHFGNPEPILLASTQRAPAADEPAAGRVAILAQPVLRVTTQPAGAAITVDGRPAGTSPAELALTSGRYRIGVDLAGHERWERLIEYDAAGDADLPIELRRIDQADLRERRLQDAIAEDMRLFFEAMAAEDNVGPHMERVAPARLADWQRGAELGWPRAQYLLGQCCNVGAGVPYDPSECTRLWHLAAQQGFAPAQLNYGLRLLEGDTIAQDAPAAVRWIRNAAEQGFADSQYQLGVCYEQGIGVAADAAEAHRWFQAAADQGFTVSCPSCGADLRPDSKFCACGAVRGAEQAACSRCGAALEPGQRFCEQCGSATASAPAGRALYCESCGHRVAPDSNFCDECGAKLS